jgi:hypothetical protein
MNQTVARMAGSFLILLGSTVEPVMAQQQPPEQTAPSQTAPASPSTMQPPVELPENPGSTASRPENTTPAQPTPATSNPQAQTPQQPSGTAVAPPIEVSGGAASKPAGVAIAPPKQKQIRSLLIKFGFLAGAGVAIGTVVGLSAASPSHVPNSPGH